MQDKKERIYFKLFNHHIHYIDINNNDSLTPVIFKEDLKKRLIEIYGLKISHDEFALRIIYRCITLKDGDDRTQLVDFFEYTKSKNRILATVFTNPKITTEPLSKDSIYIPPPDSQPLIRTLDKTPVRVNASKHDRIWSFNNPDNFLTPLHQVTLEESINTHPSVKPDDELKNALARSLQKDQEPNQNNNNSNHDLNNQGFCDEGIQQAINPSLDLEESNKKSKQEKMPEEKEISEKTSRKLLHYRHALLMQNLLIKEDSITCPVTKQIFLYPVVTRPYGIVVEKMVADYVLAGQKNGIVNILLHDGSPVNLADMITAYDFNETCLNDVDIFLEEKPVRVVRQFQQIVAESRPYEFSGYKHDSYPENVTSQEKTAIDCHELYRKQFILWREKNDVKKYKINNQANQSSQSSINQAAEPEKSQPNNTNSQIYANLGRPLSKDSIHTRPRQPLLRTLDKTPVRVDVSKHFRIWVSNNPDNFLPSLHQVTLEESINNNPSIETTLIVSKKHLSDQAYKELNVWREKAKCLVLNIEDITAGTEKDQIILEIVKLELEYWLKEPFTGNPGIVSDYLRLLFAGKGIYLDCDIYVFKNAPLIIDMAYGCAFNYHPVCGLNNDLFTCFSEKGRKILDEIKDAVIANYFHIHELDIDIEINLENVKIAAKYRRDHLVNKQSECKKNNDNYNTFIDTYVGNLAGPSALNKISSDAGQNYINNFINQEYNKYLLVNAPWNFIIREKPEEEIQMLSWLPGSVINAKKENNESLKEECRNYLFTLNKAASNSALIRDAVSTLENRDWQKMPAIIANAPQILNILLEKDRDGISDQYYQFSPPTILYFIQELKDDTPEYNQVLTEIMKNSDWEVTDYYFGITPIIYAIASGRKQIIAAIFDFVKENKPEFLTRENKNHKYAKNTPLLLAIKNGDIETALKLIPFYQKEDLLSLSKEGNSALHLACYMKMNSIILAILELAEKSGCLKDVLAQRNSKGLFPMRLYDLEFKSAKKDCHPCFLNFDEEIGKHRFKYEIHSDKKQSKQILCTLSYTKFIDSDDFEKKVHKQKYADKWQEEQSSELEQYNNFVETYRLDLSRPDNAHYWENESFFNAQPVTFIENKKESTVKVPTIIYLIYVTAVNKYELSPGEMIHIISEMVSQHDEAIKPSNTDFFDQLTDTLSNLSKYLRSAKVEEVINAAKKLNRVQNESVTIQFGV